MHTSQSTETSPMALEAGFNNVTLDEPALEQTLDNITCDGMEVGESKEETNSPTPYRVQGAELSTLRVVFLTISMMLTYFLGTACATAVTLVIPEMASDLGVSELAVQWVASSYSLGVGCGLLFSGRIADIFSRKLLYLLGLAIFCLFSILSAVIKNVAALCAVRALAGLGLAIANPAGYGIAGANVRHEPVRTIVFAAFGMGSPLGATTGTLIGGAASKLGREGWSYLFYILAGISVLPMVIGLLVIPRDSHIFNPHGGDTRIDWVGGFLVSAAATLFLFSLTQSGIAPAGFKTPYIPALLVVSIILFVSFIMFEYHLEHHTSLHPIIKPSFLARYGYKATAFSLCIFFVCASVNGIVYVTTIFYQNYKGLDALGNAVRMLPANIMGIVAAGSLMFLVSRVRASILMVIGGLSAGIAGLLYAVEPEGTNFFACEFIALLFVPFGIDFAIGTGNIAMSNLAEHNELSVAGALCQLSAQVGGALGICLSSLVITTGSTASGSLLTGIRDASWMIMAFGWIVPFIVVVALRKVGLAQDVGKHVAET